MHCREEDVGVARPWFVQPLFEHSAQNVGERRNTLCPILSEASNSHHRLDEVLLRLMLCRLRFVALQRHPTYSLSGRFDRFVDQP